MNITKQINQYLDKKDTSYGNQEVDVNSNPETIFKNSDLAPSIYLPIRTAKVWSDTLGGNAPVIDFYKKVEDSFEIHINATKRFPKIIDLDALSSVLREALYYKSLTGESDIALMQQGKEVVPLKINLLRKSYFPNKTLKMYHGIVNLDTGTSPWIITNKFYYNDQGDVIIENVPYLVQEGEDGVKEWEPVSVETFNKKYKQNIYETKNLGKIDFPVYTLTNDGDDYNGNGRSDTADLVDVLDRLDHVENAIDIAMDTSVTTIYDKTVNGTMNLGMGTQSINPAVKQLADGQRYISMPTDPHRENGNFQISDRSLKVDAWYKIKNDLLYNYYSHTGENISFDAHGNNQHTYEVMSKGDNKFRRLTAKKKQLIKDIKAIVNGVISIAKQWGAKDFIGLDVISVNVNEVDIRKEFEIETRVDTYQKIGLSDVQILMELKRIDEPTAIAMLSRAKELKELFKEPETQQESSIEANLEQETQESTNNAIEQENGPEIGE